MFWQLKNEWLECMWCNVELFFLLFFHHTSIMPTCSRRVVEPLAFKTNPYGSKKAEKNTLRHTYNTSSALVRVQSPPYYHPLFPKLKPSAIYCFCPSLCTCLGNLASLFFPSPSLPLSLALSYSVTMEVKEDNQSLRTDIWSSWTQFGAVQSFFLKKKFFIRDQEEKKWTDTRCVFRQMAQVHSRKSGTLQNRLKTEEEGRVGKTSSTER